MNPIASEARASLPNGHNRLVESTVSLRDSWFPVSIVPGFGEQLLSDFGALQQENPFANEFEEEVGALIQVIARHDDPRSLKEIEAAQGVEAMRTAAEKRMNRRPVALAIWDMHGAPARLRGNVVFKIVSPRDVMGSPVIRTYPAENFVTEAAVKIAELQSALRQAELAKTLWRTTTVILAATVGALSWAMI